MKNTIKSIGLLGLGIFMFSCANNLFLQPNNIVAGGFSGLGIVMNAVFGWDTSIFYFISNVILLAAAFVFLGKKFVTRTIIGACIFYPILLAVIPVYQISAEPIVNIFCVGMLYGWGTVAVYYSEGSGGGTAILGMIVHKITSLSYGVSVGIFDIMIMCLGLLVFGVENTIYGIIIVMTCSIITNYGISGFKRMLKVEIVSQANLEISKTIIHEMNRGATLVNAKGAYKEENNDMVVCIIKTQEIRKIKQIIHNIDPTAFVVVSQVSSTYGSGFEILIP